MEEYTRFINRNDLTVKRAIDLYNNNQTRPSK